jgi:lipoprotein NlpD
MVVVRTLLLVVVCLVIGACSSALRWAPETHVVRSGETVYSIAFQYGIDQRDLIGWNQLGTNGLIFAGQRLRLAPPDGYSPSHTPLPTNRRQETGTPAGRAPPSGQSATVPVTWRWPTNGSIIAGFRATAKTQSGVHIAGKRGQPIQAAASGEVVYAGSGLPGYGQLLIIKHTSDYLSAYGHNQRLLVGEGDRVQGGQLIARMGDGPGQRPLLHFEIRRSGQPVNPLGYLPKR